MAKDLAEAAEFRELYWPDGVPSSAAWQLLFEGAPLRACAVRAPLAFHSRLRELENLGPLPAEEHVRHRRPH
eukprot:10101395-Alexandrium_andersonii.AAC.1